MDNITIELTEEDWTPEKARTFTGDIPGEVWVTVTDFPNYAVSNWGRVRNITSGRIIKLFLDGQNYSKAKMSRGTMWQHTVSVARLVARHHVPNPDDLPEVNHRNGVKCDNRTGNLEWVTHTENMLHRWGMTRLRNSLRELFNEKSIPTRLLAQ